MTPNGPLRNSAWPMNGTQVIWLYKSPGPIVVDALDKFVFAGRRPTPVQGNQRYVVARTSMPGSRVAGGGAGSSWSAGRCARASAKPTRTRARINNPPENRVTV